ncbi:MAG: hypothetical protein ACK4K0_10245 [Flavobacteriales bacterium]
MFLRFAIIGLLVSLSNHLFAQNIKENTIKAPVVSINYGAFVPMADFAKRFGYTNSIGLFPEFKTENNWQFGFAPQFIFGNRIRENNILDGLKTETGEIINEWGEFAAYELYLRGYMTSLSVAKIIPAYGPNLNSGIIIKYSFGYMRHRIRIDNEKNYVPQLNPPYSFLYDRLTHGFSQTIFLGYQYMGNKRTTNFVAGIEYSHAFTRGIRDYQVDLMAPYHDKRHDGLLGLRLGWIVPIYKRAPKDFYFD